MRRLPLQGIRILDLTRVVAGPVCTKQLADLGAEVIKVESIQIPDETRYQRVQPVWPDNQPGDRPFNSTFYFNHHNRNKQGITVDIGSGLGQDIIRRLASISDVVAENYRPGVLDKVELNYEALCKVAPDIIMLSMSGYGNTGPWRNFRAYGTSVEYMSGLASLTGYVGGDVTATGDYPDRVSGMMAAAAVLMALWHRRKTGEGQWIDLSESEAMSGWLGDSILGYQMTGELPPRSGNRNPAMAPSGYFPCAGEDQWIGIAVEDDDRWQRLCQLMDRPELAGDARFATLAARKANEDALEQLISAWTRTQDKKALFHLLQGEDIAAGPVDTAPEVWTDPQLRERGFFQRVEFRPDRQMPPLFYYRGPIVYDGERLGVRFPAPDLGEHNRTILGGLLGMPEDELEVLELTEAIGSAPLSAFDFSPYDIGLLEQMGAVARRDTDYRRRVGLEE